MLDCASKRRPRFGLAVVAVASLSMVLTACASAAADGPGTTAASSSAAGGQRGVATSSVLAPHEPVSEVAAGDEQDRTDSAEVASPSEGTQDRVPPSVAEAQQLNEDLVGADFESVPIVTARIDEEANFGNGVTASITSTESVEVVGHLPGDRSGPGVVLEVKVANGSPDPIDLTYVVVDLIQGDGTSAIPVDLPDRSRLGGPLDPGASATGWYQFYIPHDQRSSASVRISYAAGTPTALFIGDLRDV